MTNSYEKKAQCFKLVVVYNYLSAKIVEYSRISTDLIWKEGNKAYGRVSSGWLWKSLESSYNHIQKGNLTVTVWMSKVQTYSSDAE